MQPRASGKRMRFKYAKCDKMRQIDTQTWQSSIVSGGQPAGGIRTHSPAPAPARQHQHLQASGDARRVSGVRAAVCVARSRLRCEEELCCGCWLMWMPSKLEDDSPLQPPARATRSRAGGPCPPVLRPGSPAICQLHVRVIERAVPSPVSSAQTNSLEHCCILYSK